MKKLLTLLALTLVTITANAQTYTYDVNGDGKINVTDVTCLVNKILGYSNPGEGTQAYLTCPDENHPHLIDLGLPSGTKWACCNIGATSPEDWGGHYAWGETEEKNYFDWSNYLYWGGDWDNCLDIGQSIIGTQYDVAHVKWGKKWQMPTLEQIEELIFECDYATYLMNEKLCIIRGKNGGKIIMPFAGYRDEYYCEESDFVGGEYIYNDYGCYWSGELDENNSHASKLFFAEDTMGLGFAERYSGLSVRPVWNDK